jgi:hypothetical protein
MFNSGPTSCTLYSLFLSSLAHNERNKEYSVHLVGPELNIYITKMYGTRNIKQSNVTLMFVCFALSWEHIHGFMLNGMSIIVKDATSML